MPKGYKKDRTYAGKVFKKGDLKPKNACKFEKGHKINLGRKHSDITNEKIRQAKLRENNPNWKGGKIKRNGYWFILKPKHLFSNSCGYVLQSHIVAEKYLGRYLTEIEIIHHINGKKDDDRPENLYLFENQGKHLQYHRLLNKKIITKSNLDEEENERICEEIELESYDWGEKAFMPDEDYYR